MNPLKRLGFVLTLILLVGIVLPLRMSSADPELYGMGCLPSPPGRYTKEPLPLLMASSELPSSVDLSDGLPPVGYQGNQSSCVGWAVGYYYKTFQEKKQYGWDVTKTLHQFSPAFIYNQRPISDCDIDDGMTIPSAFAILMEKGVATLAVFPYDDDDSCTQPNEWQLEAALPYRAKNYSYFFLGQGNANESVLIDMKRWLASGDTFVIAIPVYENFFHITSPYIYDAVRGRYVGGHALQVVGYDDDIGGKGIGGFKIVNSWGTPWGDGGYAYLSYNFVKRYAWEAWWMADRLEELPTYSISGYVRNQEGIGMEGVTISISGNGTVTTDSEGYYEKSGLIAGTYTLIPSKPGYTFFPSSYTVTVGPDAFGRDFSTIGVGSYVVYIPIAIKTQ